MKVSELVAKTHDNVVIYRDDEKEDNYVDIFAGSSKKVPGEILKMEVHVFGSKRKGVLDIQVSVKKRCHPPGCPKIDKWNNETAR